MNTDTPQNSSAVPAAPATPPPPPVVLCDTCPVRASAVSDEWRARGALLRMELRRHDLKAREFQIAEVILDKTYGSHLASVIISQLRLFTDFTGIGAPDVVKVLKSLHARRVIRIQTIKGQTHYLINADSNSWKAMPRVSRADMQRALNLVREQNGLPPIHIEQEAALNFKDGPDAKKAGTDIGKKPMGESMGNEDEEFPSLF